MATVDTLEIQIKSSADKAVNSLDKLIQKLSQLKGSTTNATGSLSGFNIALNNVTTTRSSKGADDVLSTVNAMKKISDSAIKTKNSFKGLASYIGKFYATYFAAVRGVKALWNGIQSSMDYIETFNYFNVTMDKITHEFKESYSQWGYTSAEAYADSFTKRLKQLDQKLTGYKIGSNGELTSSGLLGLGMNIEQMMNFQAKIGAITNSVGQLGEVSLQTQKALSMLSVDLSSLTNTSLDTVMNNLSSAILGQSRAVYRYGVDITQASLAQYALAHGVTKSVAEMTQAQKMQLRVLAILDQTKNAWTDAAQTINSVANQYRVFQAQVSNLGRTLGQVFLPIVKNLLPYLNGLVIALNRIFENLGFKLWGSSWLTDLQDGISSGIAEDLEDISDGIEDTNNSIEKLKDNLQGFDEINKLSDDSGLGSLADDFDLSKDIANAVNEYEELWNKAYEQSANRAGEIATLIYDKLTNISWSSVGKGMSKWANNLLDMMNRALRKTDWTKVGKAIGDMIAGIDMTKTIGNLTRLALGIAGGIGSALTGTIIAAPIESALIAGIGLVKATQIGAALSKVLSLAVPSLGSMNFGFASALATILALGITSAWYSVATNDIRLWEKEVVAYEATITDSTKRKISEFNTLAGNSISEFGDRLRTLDATLGNSISSITNAGSKYTTLQPLIDEWLKLYSSANLTTQEVERMKVLEDSIVSQAPEYQKVLDNKNLSYAEMADAISKTTEELIKQATAESARQQIFKLSEAYMEAKEALSDFEKENLGSIKAYNKTYDAWRDQLKISRKLTDSLDDDLEKLEKRYWNLEITEKEYRDEKNRLINTEREARELANNLGEQVKQETNNYLKLRETYIKLGEAVDNASDKLKWTTQVATGQISATDKLTTKTYSAANAVKAVVSNITNGTTEISSYSVLLNSVPNDVSTELKLNGLSQSKYELENFFNEYVNKQNTLKFNTSLDFTNAKSSFDSWKSTIEQAKIEFTITGNTTELKKALNDIGIAPVLPTLDLNNGKTIIDYNKLNSLYRNIKGFAGGVFDVPEDGWFRASHGEFFGQFDDGTSYIANNSQITDGIEAGVYKAVMAAQGNGSKATSVNVYVGGRQLTDVVIEDVNRRTMSTGVNPILI